MEEFNDEVDVLYCFGSLLAWKLRIGGFVKEIASALYKLEKLPILREDAGFRGRPFLEWRPWNTMATPMTKYLSTRAIKRNTALRKTMDFAKSVVVGKARYWPVPDDTPCARCMNLILACHAEEVAAEKANHQKRIEEHQRHAAKLRRQREADALHEAKKASERAVLGCTAYEYMRRHERKRIPGLTRLLAQAAHPLEKEVIGQMIDQLPKDRC